MGSRGQSSASKKSNTVTEASYALNAANKLLSEWEKTNSPTNEVNVRKNLWHLGKVAKARIAKVYQQEYETGKLNISQKDLDAYIRTQQIADAVRDHYEWGRPREEFSRKYYGL